MLESAPVSSLRIGEVLAHPVLDHQGRKLLAAGTPITKRFLQHLRQRHIQSVTLHPLDARQLREAEPDPVVKTIARQPDRPTWICAICGQPLPLREPRSGERPSRWVCLSCGGESSGVLDSESSRESLSEGLTRVCPARWNIDRTKLVPVAEEVAETARNLTRSPNPRAERRRSARRESAKTVIVVPVDRCLCPLGDPILMMARDVSTGGIGLLHVAPITADLLVLEIPRERREGLQVLGEVVRHRILAFCHEYGVKFVARMGT